MRIYPALDLREGRCVRLEQGRFDRVTSYSEDPPEVARVLELSGAEALHVVDLDGAKDGCPRQLELVRRVVDAVTIPVQLGGGMRSEEDVGAALEAGASRVILGSALVRDASLAGRLVLRFGEQVVAAIEVLNGQLRLHGWQEAAGAEPNEVLRVLAAEGIRGFLCTDVARDGMLSGPALGWYGELRESLAGAELLASGGISSLADLTALRSIGMDGAIVGKALYEGRFLLGEALEVAGP